MNQNPSPLSEPQIILCLSYDALTFNLYGKALLGAERSLSHVQKHESSKKVPEFGI